MAIECVREKDAFEYLSYDLNSTAIIIIKIMHGNYVQCLYVDRDKSLLNGCHCEKKC